MRSKFLSVKTAGTALLIITVLGVLYYIQTHNYLLFHVLTEFFSIVIGFCIFLIAWNGRKYLKENFLLLVGISYLFIAFLDILHTLGYKGMNIFTDYDFYANQLWIAARAIEAVSLLFAVFLINRKLHLSVNIIFAIYTVLTGAAIYTIFFSDIFPVCFVEGEGQTVFKLYSEYVIIAILVAAFILNIFKRKYLTQDSFFFISWSLVFTVISELSFTYYIDNYGFSNMIGHYSKIISFYFLYKALVEKSIQEPYDMIFAELSQRKKELEESDRLKTTLFSIISHDLRNPFVSIVSFVNILSMHKRISSDTEIMNYINQLKNSTNSALILLDNLLNWSRLEMGGHTLTMELHTVLSLVEEAAEPLLPLYQKKKVDLVYEVHEASAIKADWNTMNIVIRNILSNALKFSYPDNSVTVSSSITDSKVIISFIDRGTGMKVANGMFDTKTSTSTAGTANEKGSGLGLFLIKKYTEENGGVFHIESTPGKGTVISLSFDLPVKNYKLT